MEKRYTSKKYTNGVKWSMYVQGRSDYFDTKEGNQAQFLTIAIEKIIFIAPQKETPEEPGSN